MMIFGEKIFTVQKVYQILII